MEGIVIVKSDTMCETASSIWHTQDPSLFQSSLSATLLLQKSYYIRAYFRPPKETWRGFSLAGEIVKCEGNVQWWLHSRFRGSHTLSGENSR